MLYHYFVRVLVFAFLFSVGLPAARGAPTPITQYVQLLSNSTVSSVVGIGAGMYHCSDVLVTLTNNGTNNTKVYSAQTGAQIRNLNFPSFARTLHCTSTACYTVNPTTRTVTIFNSTTGETKRPTGGTVLRDPQTVFGVELSDVLFDGYVTDNFYNASVYQVTVMDNNNTARIRLVGSYNNTQRLIGVFYINTTTLGYAFEGDTMIRLFNMTGAYMGTFGTFGNIRLISYDYYGRLFVYDLSCLCIKIVNSRGEWIKTIESSAINNPRAMAHTRNNIYVLDADGVKKFQEPLSLDFFNSSNSNCLSRGGSASIGLSGGASPYTFQVYPDQQFVTNRNANFNIDLAVRKSDVAPFYIYRDSIYPQFSDAYSGIGDRITATALGALLNTNLAPYNGPYMYEMLLVDRAVIGFNSSSLIDTSFFSGIEFMLNVGDGGQNFTVSVDLVNLPMSPPLGSIAPNNWTKVSVSFSGLKQRYFSAFVFRDLSNTSANNFIYLDDISLVPYSSDDRQVFVTDYCNAEVSTPTFNVDLVNPLTVNIVSTPTSCNEGGIDGTLAFDGELRAAAQGGSSPYYYQWSTVLKNATTDQVTGLGRMRGNIVVYDNSLNSTFKESVSTTEYSMNSTTEVHSAPYSISWAPHTSAETIGFTLATGFNSTRYSAFEFWVNGGQYGQQLIGAGVTRNTVTLGSTYMIHQLLGLPSIPPNKWLKVSLPITPDMGIFTGITWASIGAWNQPTIYFDDLSLISTDLAVTVLDSTGCRVYSPYMEVVSPALMSVAPIVNHLSCFEQNNGAVAFNVSGGTAPYFFNWSIPAMPVTSNSTSGLAQTKLSATIYDSQGCHVPTLTVVDVLQPPTLGIVGSASPMQCYGGTARITATAIGGSGPYTYSWQASSNYTPAAIPQPAPVPVFSDTFYNKFALQGASLNLSSKVICQGTGSFIGLSYLPSYTGYCSLQFDPSPSSLTVFSIGCPSCIDTTNYNAIEFFLLLENPRDAEHMRVGLFTNNAATSLQIYLVNISTPMEKGWMKVRVDFVGVTQELADTVNIRTTAGNVSRIIVDDVVLIPKSTYVTGDSGVSAGFNSVINTGAGEYTLVITDGKSCPVSRTFSVIQPAQLYVDAVVHQPSANGKNDGKLHVNATGGTPPYSFSWRHTEETTGMVRGLGAGSYYVSVADAYGCQYNTSFVITEPDKSNTGMIAGISAGVGVFVLSAAVITAFFVRRQRQEAVQALIEVEEGERRAYKIDFAALELRSLIGAGSFGEVHSGEYKGADVAVKKLRSQQMTKQQIDEFAREAATMVGLRHPNILLFMGVCLEPQRLCIVTELMPRGNLSDILRDENIQLPIQLCYKMALDTLKGLQFIHSSGIIHRDLKSPNLLVDKHWNIKIADFGLSCARHHANDEAQVSLLWTAPEILNREPNCYTYSSDMYSFAIILWELLTKQIPWEDTNPAAITSKVVGGQRPPVHNEWDNPTRNLLTTSWAQNPLTRPSVKQARAILESEIIPLVGEVNIGGSSTSYSFSKQDSPNIQVPPPQPPFCIVVASVEGSTSLWEDNPKAMCRGMEAMVRILREYATKLGGYEISQDSPSIYGFTNATNAINFSLRTQDALRNHEWDSQLLACNKAEIEYDAGVVVRRGLRVRTALHWGFPSLRQDQDSGKISYVGNSMTTATAFVTHIPGGTIVLDQEMYNKLMSPSATLDIDPFAINPMGSSTFEGKSVPLFKMVPAVLKCLLLETAGGDTMGDEEQQPWLVNFGDIKLEGLIGAGTFGDVHSAHWNGKKVAAKKFVRQKLNGQLLLEMRTECAVLRGLNHPNIIKFEAMCMQPPNLCLISELMERGSLTTILSTTADLPWSRRLAFARDTAEGLAYLHQHEIIHRDVKSSNLLVAMDWTVKIADFGFSRIKAANQTMTQCGTVAWTAPEIFDGSHYTEKADVYSYGCVLWEIVFRKKPWAGKHSMKIIQTVETGGRLPMVGVPPDTPQRIVNLIQACWHHTPSQRPSFEQIVQQLQD